MQDDRPPPYAAWSTTALALPPRTRLFHLAPLGVGTPWTESLTSYVARLAAAHCVRVSTLIASEVGPLIAAHGHVRSLAQRNWTHYSQAINGTDATAQTMIDVLHTLTGRTELGFLSMRTWARVIAPMGLLRREQAWCPACFDEWRARQQPLYTPLLWAVGVVTTCPQHDCALRARCPGCQRAQPPLAVTARPGHCAYCAAWLGGPPVPASSVNEVPLAPWAMWVADAVGQVIAAAPSLPAAPAREDLMDALITYTAGDAGKGRQAIVYAAHISHSHLWAWRRGQTLPTLPLLLRLAGSLGLMPLQFLAPGINATEPPQPGRSNLLIPARRPRGARTGEDHPTIRGHVAAVVQQNRTPPPSLRHVAQEVGHTGGTLRRVCPDLCVCIVLRWRAARRAQKCQHDQDLAATVRQAILQVHAGETPITITRVRAHLPRHVSLRSATARQAWRETLQELCLGP